MKDQLKLLASLQDLDTRILAKRVLADKIQHRSAEVDTPIKQARSEYEAEKAKSEQRGKKKREKEALLADVQEKISKMKARSGDIKTNKEYQALLKEIDSMQQDISKIEDDILMIMEEMDSERKILKEKETRLAQESQKLDAFKKELDEETASQMKDLDSLKAERAELAQRIDPDIYSLYMSLLNTGHGLAVSRALNEICMGCNMNMPPQLFVELKKSEEIIQCPQCRRILFFREEQ